MSRKRWWTVALAVGAIALVGCGAGEEVTEPPLTDSPVTDSPGTDAPTTDAPPTTAAPDPSEPEQPDEQPTPTAPELTEAQLPTADDLEWHAAGDWVINEDEDDPTADPTDTCQQEPFNELGAVDVIGRAYELRDGENQDVAHTVVLQYADQTAAEQGYRTLRDWTRDCTASGLDGIPNAQTEVQVSEGAAEFSEWTMIDDSGEFGVFSMIGVTHRDTRVAWVLMEVAGQDNSWDYEEGGEVGAVHPMIRSLPKVNERLDQ